MFADVSGSTHVHAMPCCAKPCSGQKSKNEGVLETSRPSEIANVSTIPRKTKAAMFPLVSAANVPNSPPALKETISQSRRRCNKADPPNSG